jgi:hypothetical protein
MRSLVLRCVLGVSAVLCTAAAATAQLPPGPDPVVDILFVYTDQSRAFMESGQGGFEPTIDAAVGQLNTAFQVSGARTRVRRAGLQRLTSMLPDMTPAGALSRVRSGVMPEIAAGLASSQADVVFALLAPASDGPCYAVDGMTGHDLRAVPGVPAAAAVGVCMFPQAILRLLGIGSFPGAPDAVRPYAFGHIAVGSDPVMATLMASESCGSDCRPVDRLSAPQSGWGDAATADSVRAVDEGALFVSSYGGCTYDVPGPSIVAVPAGGGAVPFSVQTDPTCASGLPDVRGTALTSSLPDTLRRGSHAFSLVVPPNPTNSPREFQVTIGTRVVRLTQVGGVSGCPTAEIRPSEVTLSWSTARATFEYRAAAGCEIFEAHVIDLGGGNTQVVSVPTGLIGQGDAWVVATRDYGPNMTTALRTTDVHLAGTPFRIVHTARPCEPVAGVPLAMVAAGGGDTAAGMTLPTGCGWSVEGLPAWAAVQGAASGTAPAFPVLHVDASPGNLPRAALIGIRTAAGLFPQVLTQQGAACVPNLTPGAVSFPAAGDSRTFDIDFASGEEGCAWALTGLPAWIAASSTSGAGDTVVTLTAEASDGVARDGLAVLNGAAFVFGQVAAPCRIEMTTTPDPLPATGGIHQVAVKAAPGCFWSFAPSAPTFVAPTYVWPSGEGDGLFAIRVEPNPGYTRTLQVTADSTIIQAGPLGDWPGTPCAAGALSSTTLSPGWHALTLALQVRANCLWTVTSEVEWMKPHLPSPTIGAATVTVFVAPNAGGVARTGHLVVDGQRIAVNQAPMFTCAYGAGDALMPPGGGEALAGVIATRGCPWTSPTMTGVPWLTAKDPGTVHFGMSSLTLIALPNTSGQDRTAVIPIGVGGSVFVRQAPDPACQLSFVPDSTIVPSAGLEFDVFFTLGPACPWTASAHTPAVGIGGPPSPWLSLEGVVSGLGSGRVRARVQPSTFELDRAAYVVVNGQAFRATQAAFVPSAPSRQYLAEGATGAFFETNIALLNPNEADVQARLTFLRSGQTPVVHTLTVPARRRVDVRPAGLPGLAEAEFSTVIDSDRPLAIDRSMRWARGQGAHAESGIATPGMTWYLAEGATMGGFNLFYLLQNPTEHDALVRVAFLRGGGQPPLERSYRVAANSRQNIWVDLELFDTPDGPRPLLESAEVSAVVTSTNDVPIIVERAMYLDRPGQPFAAGHNSAGITAAAVQWFLAEGATGPYFDLFALIANPTETAALVRVEFLRVEGDPLVKHYEIAPRSRFNIWVDEEEFDGSGKALADAAVSMSITSTNGTPIVVERAMWWPGSGATWHEAHNSRGATEAGTRWAVAEGDRDPATNTETFVLVANTSDHPARVHATHLFEGGFAVMSFLDLPAKSRGNLRFPPVNTNGQPVRYGVIVESVDIGDGRVAQIVVERATYSDANGLRWAAGVNSLATKLPAR